MYISLSDSLDQRSDCTVQLDLDLHCPQKEKKKFYGHA